MPPEASHNHVARWYELFNAGQIDEVAELSHPDVVMHTPFPGQGKGRKGFHPLLRGLKSAFPDWTETVDLIVAEGDHVMYIHTGTGTHHGSFMGEAPSKKKTQSTAIEISRIVEDPASPIGTFTTEHWTVNHFNAAAFFKHRVGL
jgi:predicted ester cyclase